MSNLGNSGQSGQFCDKYKGSLTDLNYDCVFCSDRTRILDSRTGDLYSASCTFVAKASLAAGERAPNDEYCDPPSKVPVEEIRSSYGLMPDQVPQSLYYEQKGNYLTMMVEKTALVVIEN